MPPLHSRAHKLGAGSVGRPTAPDSGTHSVASISRLIAALPRRAHRAGLAFCYASSALWRGICFGKGKGQEATKRSSAAGRPALRAPPPVAIRRRHGRAGALAAELASSGWAFRMPVQVFEGACNPSSRPARSVPVMPSGAARPSCQRSAAWRRMLALRVMSVQSLQRGGAGQCQHSVYQGA